MIKELQSIQEAYVCMLTAPLNEARSTDNKDWNDSGHKQVATDNLTGSHDDDNSGNSYSVKLSGPLEVHGAEFHDKGEKGVPEYKHWRDRKGSHGGFRTTKSGYTSKSKTTLPSGQHVVVSHDNGTIYGHHPSHGYFKADLETHIDSIDSAKKVFDPNKKSA